VDVGRISVLYLCRLYRALPNSGAQHLNLQRVHRLQGLSHSPLELGIYRFFAGVGTGAEIIVGIPLVAEAFAEVHRAKILGVMMTGGAMGSIIGVAEYLHELAVFPNGKHDNQADSTAQFLDWFKMPFVGQGIYELYRLQARSGRAAPQTATHQNRVRPRLDGMAGEQKKSG
jgi:MFS family permease